MKITLPLILILSLFVVTGCKSPKQIVKDISVTTSNDSEDNVSATVDTYLDVGAANVPSIDLPIKKPGATESYGQFRMAQTLDGLLQVTITADLSTIFKLPGGEANLPNGSKIPVGGTLEIIEIPVEGINAEVYVASNNGIVMVGFAVAIKQLDEAGRWVGGNVNAFPAFTIKGVRGMAGVFTGVESGNTGVAVFSSFKSSISGAESELLASGAKASELLSASSFHMNRDAAEREMFRSSMPSKYKQYKLMKAFRRLERSGVKDFTPVSK